MELVIAIAANVLLGLVLLGFAGMRKTDSTRFQDSEEALRIYHSQFPDVRGSATVCDDGRVALIALQHEPGIGLVLRHGGRWVARQVVRRDLVSVAVTAGDEIKLSLADFGWPRVCLRIQDETARADWLSRLKGLVTAHA